MEYLLESRAARSADEILNVDFPKFKIQKGCIYSSQLYLRYGSGEE